MKFLDRGKMKARGKGGKGVLLPRWEKHSARSNMYEEEEWPASLAAGTEEWLCQM